MDPWQQLVRVELPLALPVIVAGIRTASVWTVGAATLATPVGADSLGNFIFGGLQTRNLAAVLVGCLGAATLALSLDGLGKLLLVGVERRSRKLIALAVVSFASLYGVASTSLAFEAGGREVVVVGSKTFTEQYILAEMIGQRVRAATGLSVQIKPSLGSTVVFDALAADAIDLYVDYSGTIWTTLMKRSDLLGDREGMLRAIERYLADEHGITLVARLGFENSYALAMRRADAERSSIRRISDLPRVASGLSVGGDYEFFGRPEWAAIQHSYGLEFKGQRSMDPSLMYQAVASGAVDVIGAFSTDGRIAADDLVVLEDDRGAIPPYDAILLAGRRIAARRPELIEALRVFDRRITAEQMRRMNLAVDIQGKLPAEVARESNLELKSLRERSAH
jgi:osmoprotectant transport system permease protein